MKYFSFTAVLSLAAVIYGMPTKRDDPSPSDADILNFALTLEHLENAFYTQGLAKYTQQDFLDAGLEPWARDRFVEISEHECTHVQFLEAALGNQAVKPCTYNFPDTDPKSFVDISEALETVGTSAYTGAAQFLTNQDYLTAAGSILSTEGRHAAWINSAVRHGNPWSTAFEAPLDLNQAFTLASQFISSCPSSNPPLPVQAFPSLTLSSTTPGELTTFSFTPASSPPSSPLFAAFISGMDTTFVQLGDCRELTIPIDLRGVVYVIVTSDGESVTDCDTVAGPMMIAVDFDSEEHPETLIL